MLLLIRCHGHARQATSTQCREDGDRTLPRDGTGTTAHNFNLPFWIMRATIVIIVHW